MMELTKQERYAQLIANVKSSYPAYADEARSQPLSLYWCEACEEINLWTYWQGRGNFDADIMLVGQDWGSPWDESAKTTMEQISLANQNQGYDYLHNNPSITDQRLISLFREIGLEVRYPCDGVFFTNFILGYRNKGISGGFRNAWVEHDREYFRELTNIVEPKVILCLARATFEGVLSAFDVKLKPTIGNYNKFIESSRNPIKVKLDNGREVYIFALAHCGALGTLNRNRGKDKPEDILAYQKDDWKKIIPYL